MELIQLRIRLKLFIIKKKSETFSWELLLAFMHMNSIKPLFNSLKEDSLD